MRLIRKLFLVFIGVLLAATAHAERSPFEPPPQSAKKIYCYVCALKQVRLKGLISCESFHRAVLQFGDRFQALQPGQSFSVTRGGLAHRFTIEALKDDSVVLKGANGKKYEVSPQ